ncbi:MAG: MFS transporter [Chthoniobacteraceae bacterium]|nr:MFS transporter [Chthoniobacteraceae bacterium]
METIVPSIMPLKFKAMGASNTIMGLFITTIPGIINTICNPIISVKSDRYRSRWGRRIPFIIATMPFLLVCLLGLGFSDKIGFWLHAHFAGFLGRFSPTAVAIAIMGTCMTLFSFFNIFVNSVFWYLFNDVVPEQFLARFMSWFRMVSMGAMALYNLFVFKHADTHSAEILIGAGILYFVGFGVMCFNVKEGQYPPPPDYEDGQTGPLAAIKAYGRECLSSSHYWYLFLANVGIVIAYSASMFTIFLYQSLGLTLEMAGWLAFAFNCSGAVVIPISGWLADRYHPVRIVMVGAILQILACPIYMVWLFWQPSPQVVFYLYLALGICLGSPIAALIAVIDPALGMRIYPRERYGQFCSANSMLRSLGGIVAGVLVGVYLDILTARWGARTAYCCLPFWNLSAHCLMLFSIVKLYRSWKRYGGDDAYVPPIPGTLEGKNGSPVPAARESAS